MAWVAAIAQIGGSAMSAGASAKAGGQGIAAAQVLSGVNEFGNWYVQTQRDFRKIYSEN